MSIILSEHDGEFNAFNLLHLPIIIFSEKEKITLFSNNNFSVLSDAYIDCSINKGERPLEEHIQAELTGIFQNNEDKHIFTMEINIPQTKAIYEFTAYKACGYIVVEVQDVTKLKKAQFLLNGSNALLEQYSDEMYFLAHTDQLTKVANRRALFSKFDQLKQITENFQCSVSLIDIDFFKRFNDAYGHEFGDYVLTTLCNHIKQLISSSSFFARIGGEEFCLIQTQSNKDESIKRVQQLLESIKELQLITPAKKSVNVSFSAGVAVFGKDGTTLDVLLNNADKALYFAKQNGRSCVIPFATELFEKRGNTILTKDVARKN